METTAPVIVFKLSIKRSSKVCRFDYKKVVRLSVVQVLPELNQGGTEKGTIEIAKALVQRGHRSIVISAGGRMLDDLKNTGSEHLTLPIGLKSLSTISLVKPLRQWIQEQNINILHVRSRLPAWISWLSWRKIEPLRRPVFIMTVHGLYSKSFYSSILNFSEKIIAISDATYNYLKNCYPNLTDERICIIPRGINPADFPHGYQPPDEWLCNWYKDYYILKNSTILTLPGRISPSKGHIDFIELIDVLRKQGFFVKGLIVGECVSNNYMKKIRRKIKECSLENIIFFTGYRKDIREIYALSNIVFSLSSNPEAFGRTVLEALSMGIPVIGYDHGGVSELLRKIYPFGLVKINDKSVLLEKTKILLYPSHNKPLVPKISHLYTLKQMQEQTIDLYESLISKNPSKSP